MKTAWTSPWLAAGALALAGCAHGYQSAADLESEKRGPRACEASCQELGMRMSAFVLVGHDVSGCVCSPLASAPAPAAPPPRAPAPPPPPAEPAPAPGESEPAAPPSEPAPPPASSVDPGAAAGAVAAGYLVIQYAKQATQRADSSNPPTTTY